MRKSIKKFLSVVMSLVLFLTVFAGYGDAMNGDQKTTPSVNAGANPEDFGSDEKESDYNEIIVTVKHYNCYDVYSASLRRGFQTNVAL